jgi:hypothetical protein
MKKIVRLTESDLVRIVKRVIAEDVTAAAATAKPNNGLKAFQLIKAGMSGLGTDEAKVSTGVFTIKNKADYQTCMSYVKKAGYPTIMAYIATDMDYDGDTQSSSDRDPALAMFYKQDPMLLKFANYLSQFNPNEKVVK